MVDVRIDEGLWALAMLPEGVIETWVAVDGGQVSRGDHIANVRIEGALHEILAPTTGRLRVYQSANAIIEPGSVVGEIAP